MTNSNLIQRFFQAQHQKLMRKAYTLLQGTCCRREVISQHGEWLRRKAGGKPEITVPPAPIPFQEKRRNPRD